MRQLFAVACVGVAAAAWGAEQAGSSQVEVKGPHICCAQCIRVVGAILGKVDGVTDVKADKSRTVRFTAKDDQAARAGFRALVEGGFFGRATQDGKEIKLDLPAVPKGAKADVVTVKDVHVCCKQCQTAINNLFKDAKVSYEGKGPRRDVRIEGTGLDRAEVLQALHKAGFHGHFDGSAKQ
jgi:periplasmic mercuric ion binding protein